MLCYLVIFSTWDHSCYCTGHHAARCRRALSLSAESIFMQFTYHCLKSHPLLIHKQVHSLIYHQWRNWPVHPCWNRVVTARMLHALLWPSVNMSVKFIAEGCIACQREFKQVSCIIDRRCIIIDKWICLIQITLISAGPVSFLIVSKVFPFVKGQLLLPYSVSD